MENELKNKIKNTLVFSYIMLALIIIGEVVISVILIKTMLFQEESGIAEMIFVAIDITGFVVADIFMVTKIIVPCKKDAKFYVANDVERMRAIVVKVKHRVDRSSKAIVRNLETGEETMFQFSGKDLEMDKIYDFIYLKYSKTYKHSPVTFGQLTEDNREKASKIDFNQKD